MAVRKIRMMSASVPTFRHTGLVFGEDFVKNNCFMYKKRRKL